MNDIKNVLHILCVFVIKYLSNSFSVPNIFHIYILLPELNSVPVHGPFQHSPLSTQTLYRTGMSVLFPCYNIVIQSRYAVGWSTRRALTGRMCILPLIHSLPPVSAATGIVLYHLKYTILHAGCTTSLSQ